jgi:hypothetical protein
MGEQAVVFDDWVAALTPDVSRERYHPYREAIVQFRYWLRQTGKPATVATFKEHLAWKRSYLSPNRFAMRLAALRWYFRRGVERMIPAATPTAEASAALARQPAASVEPPHAPAAALPPERPAQADT